MPRTRKANKKPIEQYDHKGSERLNNPLVGLVTPETDKESGKKTYAYNPHLGLTGGNVRRDAIDTLGKTISIAFSPFCTGSCGRKSL